MGAIVKKTTPRFPIALSSDGRSLVDASGRPFFIVGDSAWSLESQLTAANAELYLQDRVGRGFNTVIMEVMEHRFCDNAPNNANNIAPFTVAGDFTTPNSSYFSQFDSLLQTIANKNMLAILAPMYLGFGGGNEGWAVEIAAQTTAQIQSWGDFLGTRYKNQSNIIWVLGGDVDPSTLTGIPTRIDSFVTGLRGAGDTHLITFHSTRGQSGRVAYSGCQINTQYSTYANSASDASTEYARSPFMPTFGIEFYYENEHTMSALQLRNQAYWSVLSGATLGHIFGNDPVWSFNAINASAFQDAATTWQASLGLSGSHDVVIFGRIFNSRQHHLLTPDSSIITAGAGAGTTLAVAAKTSNSATVIVYIPTGATVTIDMTKVSGANARGWWVNPSNGATTNLGTFATSGTQAFAPPDTNDWVLVLDDASLNLRAPGV